MFLSFLVPLVFLLTLGVAVARSLLPARRPPQLGTEFSAVLKGSGTPLGAHEIICVDPGCSPRAVLVFIPGNPGQPAFYSAFAERLSARLEVSVPTLNPRPPRARSLDPTLNPRPSRARSLDSSDRDAKGCSA